MKFQIKRVSTDDSNEVAEVIYRSLNDWYRIHRGIESFAPSRESMLIFPRVYESLDPGCCVAAVDPENGRIAAISFFIRARPHISLGIADAHPDYWGKGRPAPFSTKPSVLPARRNSPSVLSRSAMNFESFNLYNSRGFVPFAFFQDMTVKVPEGGFDVNPPAGVELANATLDDVDEMAELEYRLCGIRRDSDLRYFVENREGIWAMSLAG